MTKKQVKIESITGLSLSSQIFKLERACNEHVRAGVYSPFEAIDNIQRGIQNILRNSSIAVTGNDGVYMVEPVNKPQ